MKRTVIIAEKRPQALDYAKALQGKQKREKNAIVITDSPFFDGEIHLVYCRGHLMKQVIPDDFKKKWEFKNYPLPTIKAFDYEPIGTSQKELFNTIKSKVKKCSEIVIATDPEREGERIAWLVLNNIPDVEKKIIKRRWGSSLTPKSLQKDFANLKNASDTKNGYYEAESRAESDFLVGYNLSPVVTLAMKKNGLLKFNDKAMSVGRVQSPALFLVVANDRAIKNFEPQKYWQLMIQDKDNEVEFANNLKFGNHDLTKKIISELSHKNIYVKSVEVQDKTKQAPKLFNLGDLQTFCRKQYKLSKAEVLEIAEQLYLKKLTTYARTSSRYIGNSEFEYLLPALNKCKELATIDLNFEMPNTSPRKKYVDNKKVEESESHHAIIPTDMTSDKITDQKLSAKEQLVYNAIVHRTFLMFAEDNIYRQATVTLGVENDDLLFETRQKADVILGFKAHELNFDPAKVDSKKMKLVQDLQNQYKTNTKLSNIKILDVEKQTKAPSRITETTLSETYMENKYKLGTVATRTAIIDNLVDRGYVKREDKKGELYPTERGTALINFLVENKVEFVSPKLTSIWENDLAKVGQGVIEKSDFVKSVQIKINQIVANLKEKYQK